MGSLVSRAAPPEPKYRVTPEGAKHVGSSDIGQFLQFLLTRGTTTAAEFKNALRADIDMFYVEMVEPIHKQGGDSSEYDETLEQHERILRDLPSLIKYALKVSHIEYVVE